jgi:tetratricopeptide (TPR) repeat protein
MKKVVMMMLAVITAYSAFAQSKNVNKANTAFTKGELAEAAALIEPALQDEKTKEKGRTWYVRAQIYSAIAESEDEAIRNIDPDALSKAAESYRKVLELEKEGSNYNGLAMINLNQLSATVINKGIEYYKEDDFENALESFVDYSIVMPDDTTGYIYSALMAQQLERYSDVVDYYDKMFSLGYYPKNALNVVIYYEQNRLDNPEKAMEYVKLAMEKYPEDNNFRKTSVDILIKMNKLDDAIESLKEAITKEPENALLYSNLGMLYDSQENYEAAVEQYKKALEIDPVNRFSLINLAVFYVGQGDKIMHSVNEMSIKDYNKNIDQAEKDASVEYKKALPLLLKVVEIDENDELGLQNLQAVYAKLKDGTNATKIYDKRKALGYIIDGN